MTRLTLAQLVEEATRQAPKFGRVSVEVVFRAGRIVRADIGTTETRLIDGTKPGREQ